MDSVLDSILGVDGKKYTFSTQGQAQEAFNKIKAQLEVFAELSEPEGYPNEFHVYPQGNRAYGTMQMSVILQPGDGSVPKRGLFSRSSKPPVIIIGNIKSNCSGYVELVRRVCAEFEGKEANYREGGI